MLQTVTEELWAALQSKAETNMTASTVINQIHVTPAPNTKSRTEMACTRTVIRAAVAELSWEVELLN